MNKISIRNAKFAKIGLQDLINKIPKEQRKRMVEIGCYVGDSTEIFSNNFEVVYAVDPWENGYDDKDAASFQTPMSIVESQFEELAIKQGNIIKNKMSSKKAVKLFDDNSLDFVYIDGLHTCEGVKEDIELWLPKIKKGGFIGGHDYKNKHHPGVQPAVDEFKKPDFIFRDTSWLIKL
jgi:hypothetical protein